MTPLGARRLGLHRRDLLAATVSVLAFLSSAQAATLKGIPDWSPNGGSPPQPVRPGPWQFFSPEEGAVVEALVDRLIPPDPNTPGGKEAGCAVFIDRQLAGPYGEARGLYMRPPFQDGDPQQGYQSPLTPAMRYRRSLAALDKYCQASFAGKRFHELPPDQQDKLIAGLQSGTVKLENVSGRGFFELLLQNTQEGFFRRPGLWRQSRHGRLEDDRISRHALRLSRLGRAPQREVSTAASEYHRPHGVDSPAHLTDRRGPHGTQASGH